MTHTKSILKFKLRSPYMIGAFSSFEEYKEFEILLNKKRKSPSEISVWNYSGYGTILGDLIQNFNHVIFVGSKYDFILDGYLYVEYFESIEKHKRWKNYLTEQYTMQTDVESAGSAIAAMEYIGSCTFDYVVVYKSLLKNGQEME